MLWLRGVGFSSGTRHWTCAFEVFKACLVCQEIVTKWFYLWSIGKVSDANHRACRILSYWLKTVSGKKSRYVNVLYDVALSRIKENNSYNWVSDAKQLLCSIGFGDVWYNQGVIDQDFCVSSNNAYLIYSSKVGVPDWWNPHEHDFTDKLLTSICSTDY